MGCKYQGITLIKWPVIIGSLRVANLAHASERVHRKLISITASDCVVSFSFHGLHGFVA